MKIVLHGRTRRTLQSERIRARNLGDIAAYDRYHGLLLLEHLDLEEMSPVLGYSERTLFAWVSLLAAKGPEGLRTKRKTGRPPRLPNKDKRLLKDWVEKSRAVL